MASGAAGERGRGEAAFAGERSSCACSACLSGSMNLAELRAVDRLDDLIHCPSRAQRGDEFAADREVFMFGSAALGHLRANLCVLCLRAFCALGGGTVELDGHFEIVAGGKGWRRDQGGGEGGGDQGAFHLFGPFLLFGRKPALRAQGAGGAAPGWCRRVSGLHGERSGGDDERASRDDPQG